ncbi:MAG: cation:proton antiporter [Christensenellales bacterium]
MVDLVLIGLHFFVLGNSMSIADAIVLGAIATATAPAATLMVVRQYKAKGELTDLLLPIVALDDAVGLIVFAVSFGVAKAINYGNYDMTSILVEQLLEIVLSILMGFVMGSIFSAAEKYFKSNSKRLSLSITFVILTVALSMMEFEVGGVKIGFSSLLVCMMLGTVFCNVRLLGGIMEDRPLDSAAYILFFVLAARNWRRTYSATCRWSSSARRISLPALASGWARASARSS